MEESIENVDGPKDDFISQLPDKLIHQILSFLDMVYVVQTSILAKRWRYLWTSLPFLKFNELEFNRSMAAVGEVELKPDYKNLPDFLDRILCLRNGSNLSIQTFCLCCLFQEIFEFKSLDLSKCFYTQPDQYVGLPCLKILHLKSVVLVGGDRTDSFFTSCPVLETLIILDCMVMQTDKLNISSPQLKYLELGELTMDDEASFSLFDDPSYLTVTVSAPNLISFKCTDLVSVEYSLVDVPYSAAPGICSRYPRIFFSGTKEKDAKIVIQSFSGNYNAVYEVSKAKMESLVTPFCNLRLLKLKTRLSTSEYRAITYLFETCPNVETIELEMISPLYSGRPSPSIHLTEMFIGSSKEEKNMKTDECLEAYFSSECNFSFHHLKFVNIWEAIGSLKELEFLKFLLKNATNLEKMNVNFSTDRLPDREMGRRFREELVTFSKSISAGVVIWFSCFFNFPDSYSIWK